MTTRVRANAAVPRENRVLQAKRVGVKNASVAQARSALGEIGNKQAAGGSTKDQDLKKSGIQRKTVGKVEEVVPKIQLNDADDEDVEMAEETAVVEARQFPEGVVDIDAIEDQFNPQLLAEYAPAIYAYLREVEEGLSIRKDFLTGCFVNGKMRGVLVDWLIEVHSQFKLLQETLYMTIYIIDKFLQVEGFAIRRNKLQLVGVSAMFIASKVEEMYAPEINDFVYITDNAYTAAEIRQMELRMLNTLGFNFSRPLPLHFLRRNSKAGDVDVLQHTVAKYLIEMSLLEYDMAHVPPSLMAAAALFLSLRLLEPNATLATTWTPTLAHYSTYSSKELLPVVCRLALALTKRDDSKLKAVHTKYVNKKFMKVGELADLQGEVVQKLARKQLASL